MFGPWRIQCAIDAKAVGGLNYGACDTIRAQVEQLGKSERGVFPSGSCVATHAKELELHAASAFNLGYREVESEFGLSYTFDFAAVLRLIVEAHGMVDVCRTGSSEPPMLIGFTLDGAALTKELGHASVTGGIKLIHPKCICPLTLINQQSISNQGTCVL